MSNSSMWRDYVSACMTLGSLEEEGARRRSEIERRHSAAIAGAESGSTVVDESAAVSRALKEAESALAEVFSMFDKHPGPATGDQSDVVMNAAAMQREAKDVEAWSSHAVSRGRSLARTLSRIRAEEQRVSEDTVVDTPAPAPESDPERGPIIGVIAVIILVGIVVAVLMMLS